MQDDTLETANSVGSKNWAKLMKIFIIQMQGCH